MLVYFILGVIPNRTVSLKYALRMPDPVSSSTPAATSPRMHTTTSSSSLANMHQYQNVTMAGGDGGGSSGGYNRSHTT